MARHSHEHRASTGALLAPVFLRVVLAVTFIWAGLGKVIPTMPVNAQQQAVLASMGVEVGPPPKPSTPPEQAPAKPLPPSDTEPVPGDSTVAPTPAERAANPNGSAAQPTPPVDANATPEPAAPTATTAAEPAVRVARVYGLALKIHDAAHPGLDASGKQMINLWPSFIGEGNWPRYFAIAVVIAEIAGGVLVGLGLLTRLGAAMLAGVMLGAVWLDQLGPAIQAGNTVLLVLPAHGAWDIAAWRPLLWQLSLLGSACALMLLGAGAPSLDRALGWMQGRGDDDDL